MSDFIFYTAALLVTLGVLVTFHEWGHFYAARKLGVKVLRFSVGFGKPLWKKIGKDGVEYVVAWIPLGGYVKMLDEREGDVPESDLPFSFNRQPLWKRNVIVAAGPFANFVLAIVVFWIMFLYGIEMMRPVVGPLSPKSIAAQSGMKEGDRILSVDGESVESWQDTIFALAKRIGDGENIELIVESRDSTAQRKISIATANWEVDDRRPDIMASLGFNYPETGSVIGSITENGAAQSVDIRPGDRIVKLDEQPINLWREVSDYMLNFNGGEIKIYVDRKGEIIEFQLVPKRDNERFMIGVGAQLPDADEYRKKYFMVREYGPVDAFEQSIYKFWGAISLTATMFKKLVLGELSTKSLGGPISIAEGAGSSARGGLVYFLSFLGMISVNLGLINLLPVPVLDGGHLLFNLLEAIKGKPLSEASQEFGMRIGVALVLGLMAIAIFNDIARL